MKKVLLLSCFLSMTVHAGTGGGTSTPPARGDFAQIFVSALDVGLESLGGVLLLDMDSPLPWQWTLSIDKELSSVDFTLIRTITLLNLKGESRSYYVEDGQQINTLKLTDRRTVLRNSIKR